ncbi:CD109 antigen-like [Anopheles maculipalpis]|uniref:CD109 antigen-like n=1 Tax=Anopheles maculipalpis TaxID=1496333 RepID=UPI0021597F30|nr:CD109 antigen-like [Anopheles maculipalpis]
MYSRVAICCLVLCTITGSALADEGDYISILTTWSSAGSDNVSIILANMDNVASTFEIENIGMEDGDLIVSTTIDPKHVQLYLIPPEWSQATSEAIQLDIVTSSKTPEEARLTGQIKLAQQPKVLIQLSDTLHTPGDFLKFRILLTDELNKPLPSSEHPFNLTIALQHESQHTVASWDAKLVPGDIYSGQHLFADDRDIGDWNMTVTIGEQTTSKRFQVMLYSAPIHRITIQTEDMVTLQDADLTINVEAMYTFGKPLRGNLTVTVTGGDDRIVKRSSPIAGNKIVMIPMEEIITARNTAQTRIIHVNATVSTTNGITQRTYSQARSVEVYASPYKLDVLRMVDFTPGQNATLFIRLTKANGKPLIASGHRKKDVSVHVMFDNDDSVSARKFVTSLDNDGTAMLSFPTDSNAELLTVAMQYQEVSVSITLEPAYSPQLYVRMVNPKQFERTNGFKLALVSSHPMDGVLAVIRKHDGENIPILVYCNLQNYYEHFVPLIQPDDVQRVYVFGRFGGTLVQASTSYQEPALSNRVTLLMNGTNVRIFSKGDESRIGIAVYEGLLDFDHLESIYARSMFNGSIYPAIEDVFPLSINDLTVMPPVQQMGADNQQDRKLNISASPLNRLLHWEEGTTSNQKATFQFQPPPHINQLTVSAFVFSPSQGLGIAEPIQWQRQQDIEIYLHIPYSVKKLEVTPVDVYIVNNRLETVDFLLVELLNRANEFQFLNNSGRTDATQKILYGRLKPNEVQRAEFLIRPKKLGSITLKANAYSQGNVIARAETILRTIPESVQQIGSIVRLFTVDNSTERLDAVKIPIPRTVDIGSEKITLSLYREQLQIASLPVSLLLDKLVPADPYTETIRASLTLDVLSLAKLEWTERKTHAERVINETTPKIVELSNDNAYFTISDQHSPASECWDTVIALQALIYSNRHLHSEDAEGVIISALNWLKTKQANEGHFCADEDAQDEMKQIEKTSHVLLIFLEMRQYIWRHVSVIDKARSYLLSNTASLHTPYHLALVGHVLQFSLGRPTGTEKHALIDEKVSQILNTLLDQKLQASSGLKMWWNGTASATDLETTAYVLLLMTSKKYLFNAAPIVNWIKGQPYRRATPSITPNSHIALRALIEYAKHTTFLEKRYKATIIASDKTGALARQELHHDSNNHVLILPASTRSVSFTISGTISGAFEINYSYMESVTMQTQKFNIDLYRYETSDEDYTDWRVCIRFLPKGFYEKTRMVTCEISFPTGYIALDDSVDELRQLDDVVTTVLRNDETLLSITFEEIGVQQKCFNVTGFRRNVETRQLPGTIRVFDLADASNIAYKQMGNQV